MTKHHGNRLFSFLAIKLYSVGHVKPGFRNALIKKMRGECIFFIDRIDPKNRYFDQKIDFSIKIRFF